VTPDYPLAFLTGLAGGFGHCIGMCGPIVAAYTLGGRQGGGFVPHLLYNAGRIITYTFVGALMGLGGSFVNTAGRIAGFQNAVAIAAGLFMIVMGLGIAGLAPFARREGAGPGVFTRAAGSILEGGSPLRFFPLGLLLGFLPCGLSWSIFAGAAATGDMAAGFLFAFSFGIATVPALLLFGLVVGWLGNRVRAVLYRLSGAVVAVMGVVFVVRGIRSYVAM
jgi:sulfite exporter TauE/SafE